jgi:hypothetical protein
MKYTTGAAFRRALEDRLLAQSNQASVSLVRLRKLVAFDRFLARLTASQPGAWLLKGGVALQLRLGNQARTTKDIDVLLTIPRTQVHRALISAAMLDLGDWFTFSVRPVTDDLPGPGEGGLRFFVTARLDGRTFESFHVDVGSGDPVVEPAESLAAPPLLDFAGIPPMLIPCYPLTQHLAEKVHAYVRTRATGESTRVKDLVDIVLIAEYMAANGPMLLRAIRATFAALGTDELPSSLPAPPSAWTVAFKKMAEDVGLTHKALPAAAEAARRFLDPVLSGVVQGDWSPADQAWE